MALAVQDAAAAGIESLVMPGKLVEGHAEYEDDCDKCHRPFSKESQKQLCRDCHEKVDADIQGETGFHGRSSARNGECSHCHTDHQGRDADIVGLGRETFNHDVTDYPLEGAHVGVLCGACHAGGKKYREAPVECIGCHRSDDIHEEKLGEKCSDCHEVQSWSEQKFNHDDTDYPLIGKHEEVRCDSCHVAQQYKDIPSDCYSCHRLNDVHAGRYGSKCGDCHSEESWTRIDFDHDRNTDYSLTGEHRKVKCNACHGGNFKADDLETECIACHRGDDDHRGQHGEKCDSCHKPHGWDKVKFKHDADTDFPLRGKHQEVGCASCHRGNPGEEGLATQCISCHRADDVHAGQAGERCDKCHSESGWHAEIRFDHGMSRFPLIGMHEVVPCEECHLTPVFRKAAQECNACHQVDDVHEKKLGERCEDCHNPNAWSLWEFDHDTRTDFVLDGKHAGVDCHVCHIQPVDRDISLSTGCDGCHREDDVHDGTFGRYCERCHNAETFETVEIR